MSYDTNSVSGNCVMYISCHMSCQCVKCNKWNTHGKVHKDVDLSTCDLSVACWSSAQMHCIMHAVQTTCAAFAISLHANHQRSPTWILEHKKTDNCSSRFQAFFQDFPCAIVWTSTYQLYCMSMYYVHIIINTREACSFQPASHYSNSLLGWWCLNPCVGTAVKHKLVHHICLSNVAICATWILYGIHRMHVTADRAHQSFTETFWPNRLKAQARVIGQGWSNLSWLILRSTNLSTNF